MITDKQNKLLDSLISTGKNSTYSEDDYDIMGIYGHCYKQISEVYDDEDEYYEEDEEDEEVPY